jgi:hypothetical protein
MIDKFKTLLSSFFATTEDEVYIEPAPEEHCLMLLIKKMIDDKCLEKSITKNNFSKSSYYDKENIDFYRFLNHLKNIASISDYPSDCKKCGKFYLILSGMEYHIMVNINDDDSAFKIRIKEIGAYVGLESNIKDCKTLKRSELTVTFPVRPEYIAKRTTDPKKWSIIVFFIILIGGFIVIMITPDADIWGVVVGSIVLPAFIYFMVIYNNMQQKEIYVGINNKSLSLYAHMVLEIEFNKLKKIELIRDYKNGRLLSIKFNTKNSLRQRGGLKSEMFDLEPILRQLKSLDTIPQDIWIEKIAGAKQS